MTLIGAVHVACPGMAWFVYREWGRLWGADPQEIAPQYRHRPAMLMVGVALGGGGVAICLLPFVLGYSL
jgi:hypothetical protein